MASLPGILLRSDSAEFGDRVFYVEYGRRHWVRDASWLAKNGFRWPDDVLMVPESVLKSYANGSAAPLRSGADLDWLGEAADSTDVREVLASELRGTGIEFGSGASPFPIPLECHTLYADAYSYATLRDNLYPGQTLTQIVRPDFVTNLQTLDGIADESLDFVVACHVIEHTVSPITALQSCYRALRPGGQLLLVVPDMQKTFDSGREKTPLSHLIEDHQHPDAARDLGHFIEFFSKALPVPEGRPLREFAEEKQRAHADIHYHCWDYESFGQMVAWITENVAPWSAVWSHPTLPGAGNIEFYFRLTK